MLDATTATKVVTDLGAAVTEQAPFVITVVIGVTALVWGANLANNAIKKRKLKF